jgi:HTH-type transcriptional regulator/antitoxin HigA
MSGNVNEIPDHLVRKHPGRLLREMLSQRGWTLEDLSAITGYSRTAISTVSAERGGISPDMAVALGAAFGNDPAQWLGWDAAYQLSLVETKPDAVEARARLHNVAPIREMRKRGWIKGTKTTDELEAELDRFFGGSIADGIQFPIATLRRDPLRDLNPAEKAWCFRARQMAEAVVLVSPFDPSRLHAAEKKLRQLAAYIKEVQRLPEILAYYGIRFVVLEPLPGTEIDGAAFWIDSAPAIAVSIRWDRVDAFWFTVMHEFMHVKNRDAYSVDVNLLSDGESGIKVTTTEDAAERLANDQAADLLVPKSEMDSFIKRTSPLYASTRIIQFANRIKMHPGVIVGQLQHRGELRYSSHRDLLVRVRKLVTEAALTDGWGRSIAPTVT